MRELIHLVLVGGRIGRNYLGQFGYIRAVDRLARGRLMRLQLEERADHGFRQAPGRALTLDRRGGGGLKRALGGHVRERRAGIDGVENFLRLVADAINALLLLPRRQHAVVYLRQRAHRRRRDLVDAQHVDAAVGGVLQRADLARLGGESGLQKFVGGCRNSGGLAVQRVAGVIGVADRYELEAQIARERLESGAAGELVLDALAQAVDGVARIVALNVGAQRILHFIEGFAARRLDRDHMQNVEAEWRLDRCGDAVPRQCEGRVRDARVEAALGDGADVLRRRELRRLGGRGERLAGFEAGLDLVGGRLIRRDHLFDVPLLRHLELRLALLVLALEVGVRHIDAFRHVVDAHDRHGEAAKFRRAEEIAMLIVELLQVGIAGLADVRDERIGEEHGLGDALLGAAAIERVDQRLRRGGPGGNRLREIAAHDVGAQSRLVLRLRNVALCEDRSIALWIELAVRTEEGRVLHDLRAHRLVARCELQALHLEADKVGIDQLVELLVDHAQLFRLLEVEAAAEHLAELVDAVLHGPIELVRTDLEVTHARDADVGRGAQEHVIDTPAAKADDQQPEQDFDDQRIGFGANGLQHGIPPARAVRRDARRPDHREGPRAPQLGNALVSRSPSSP